MTRLWDNVNGAKSQIWSYVVNQRKVIEMSGKLHSKRTEKFYYGDLNFYEVSPEVSGQLCEVAGNWKQLWTHLSKYI